MSVDKTAITRVKSKLDTKRKELGVDDALCKISGVTSKMLVAFGKHGIKTVEDLADCATDDLIGWVERKNGKSTRHAGALEGFAIKRKEAEAIIMQARFKAGWIDESAPPPPQAHKNTLWDIKFETREEAYAPIADDLAAFKQHKKPFSTNCAMGVSPRPNLSPSTKTNRGAISTSTARGTIKNGTKRKRINLWGGTIEYEEPAPGSKVAAIIAEIEVRLAAFDDHKAKLLTLLHDAYKRGPQSKSFDRDKVWSDFKFFTGQLLLQESAKSVQLTMSPANRCKQLRKIADALSRARCAVDQSIKDDLGDELCRVWWKKRGKSPEAQQPQQDPLNIEQEFKKAVENLAALEIAALCAIKPGPGPFARFVLEFLTALGHRNVVYHSVTEAIKDARKIEQMHPVANGMRPPPFNLGGKTPRISNK